MPIVIRRLGLGLFLIALASAILLYADRGRRVAATPPSAAPQRTVRIAILQHADSAVMEDGVRGMLEGLASRGYKPGENGVTIDRFNAQGDIPTDVTIARQITAGDYDLVLTSSTPSMQAVANNNKEGKVRHVFGLVADPFASGVGLDRDHPLQHPPYMVGQGSFPPVETAFEIARKMFPKLERIGVAWNPAEANSLAFVEKGRAAAKRMGITLLEANADSSSAVSDAVNSLIGRNAQAIWVGGDNTVATAIDTVIAIGRRMHVPVFSVLPGAPDRGTLFDAGFDFVEVGRQAGLLAADVLDGTDPATIPIRDVGDIIPPYLSVNTTVLEGLRDPWTAPPDVLKTANVVVDATGTHRQAVPAAPASGAAPTPAGPSAAVHDTRPVTKTWRLELVELMQSTDIEDAEKGVLDGITGSGLVEGKDFVKVIRNAQGDMPTVNSMIDAALSDGGDMLLTFSTPTLQAAMQKTKRIPIVFNYVSSAIAAGAATSDTDHVANVTGVYLMPAYDQMLAFMKEFMPKVHVIGTVYNPAEVNMTNQLDVMKQAAAAAGMTVKAVAASNTSEVGDATLALISNGIDAICQLPGNLTASAFPNMVQGANRAHMPMFVFQSSQVRDGGIFAVSRDYYESGRQAGEVAARVMRGDSPAKIPLAGFAGAKLMVNLNAAKIAGLTVPPDVLAQADEVLGR